MPRMPKLTQPIKSELPISYQEALKNQYLSHLRSMVSYVGSMHLEFAAQEQVRANELMEILNRLGEKDLHARLQKMGTALGAIIHDVSTADRNKRYNEALDRFAKKPLHKKRTST